MNITNFNKFSIRYALFFSFLLTIIFYLPILYQLSNSIFFTYGDGFRLWAPSLVHSYNMLHQNIWMGIDWSSNNGVTDYFCRPNLLSYYPPILLGCLIFSFKTLASANRFLSLLIILQTILACFALQMICQKYFRLSKETSLFIAVCYLFCAQFSTALGLFPFAIIESLFPVMLWLGLEGIENNTLTFKMTSAFLGVCLLTGGYLPLALFSFILAAAFALIYFFCIADLYKIELHRSPIQAILRIWSPFILSGCVVFFYYLAIVQSGDVSTTIVNLNSAAHLMNVMPNDLLYTISSPFMPEHTPTEQMTCWGAIPLIIFGIAIFVQKRIVKNRLHSRLMIVGLIIYFSSFLLIFGPYSRASDILYYLVPGLGWMHIYARYGMYTKFFLFVGAGILLEHMLTNEQAKKIAYVFLIPVFAGIIYLCLGDFSHSVFTNYQYLIIELGLVAGFLIFFTKTQRPSTFFAALVFISSMNFFVFLMNLFEPTASILNTPVQLNLLNGIIASTNKPMVKIADITNPISSFIPRNYPWLYNTTHKNKISEYIGYDIDSGYPDTYRAHFPYYGTEDWNYLLTSGVDYVVYDKQAKSIYPTQLTEYVDTKTIVQLNPETYIAKVKTNNVAEFDNGYIQLFTRAKAKADIQVNNFSTKFGNLIQFDFSATQPSRLVYPFFTSKFIKLYVNGNLVPWGNLGNFYFYDFNPGTYKVEIKYQNLNLKLFLLIYFLFILTFLCVLIFGSYKYINRKKP